MRDIDSIIEAIRNEYPNLLTQQLQVTWPADDDGLWFFKQTDSPCEVQLESPEGSFPFLVESNEHGERQHVQTVSQAVELIKRWLHLDCEAI